MLQREERSERFKYGISTLDNYLYYNDKENFHDIHIASENFFCDLLNILFDYSLVNANKIRKNIAGYDLMDTKSKLLVQVSASARPEKIKHTFETIGSIPEQKEEVRKEIEKLKRAAVLSLSDSEKLENLQKEYDAYIDFTNYRVKFMFLTRGDKLDKVKAYKGRSGGGYQVPSYVSFNQAEDIICMDDLVHKVDYLSEVYDTGVIDHLDEFMRRNSNLFNMRFDPPKPADAVQDIIQEYYDNFTRPLFLHTYSANKENVTLRNLYVDPNYMTAGTDIFGMEGSGAQIQSGDEEHAVDMLPDTESETVTLLGDFIWGHEKDRFLFIDGDAAVGKTSLVSWLCYHYKEQDRVGNAIFCDRKMICIRLRELTREGLGNSVEKCILDHLRINDRKRFDEDYQNAVFVLDGADEINMVARVSVQTIEQFLLDFRKAFKNHKIICTSRPKFIHVNIFEQSEIGFQHVIIEHFDKTRRERWLTKYMNTGEKVADETKDYILNLNNQDAGGVADTPLALYLLVACKIRDDIKKNQWALFHEIFHNAIIQTRYNENLRDKVAHPILGTELGEKIYTLVGEIAFAMFRNSEEERYYITSSELDRIVERLISSSDSDLFRTSGYFESERNSPSGHSRELIRNACVLCAYWKKDSKDGALEFYHNDIRDFFFSEYIYRELQKIDVYEGDDYVNAFLATANQLLYHGYIAGTTWEQTYRFLYLRLQYICGKDTGERRLSAEKVKENYAKVISAAVHVDFSKQEYYNLSGRREMFTYAAAKRAFINTALLLKVILIGSGLTDEPVFWIDNKEKEEWEQSELLTDWGELFTMGIRGIKLPLRDTKLGTSVDSREELTFSSFCNWSGFDFSNANVMRCLFNTVMMNDVSLSQNYVYETTFVNSVLHNADFYQSDLSRTLFSNSFLENCNFAEANIDGCALEMVEMKGGKFTTPIFFDAEHSYFENILLPPGIKFNDMEGCVFSRSWMNGADFRRLSIKNSSFDQCELKAGMLNDVRVAHCVFSDCHLEKSVMNRSVYTDCRFINCHFDDADILKGSFHSCIFVQCNFKNAFFYGANMTECLLDRSSMESLRESKTKNCDKMKCEVRNLEEGEMLYVERFTFA